MATRSIFPHTMVQQSLAKLGHYKGKIDGDFGDKSNEALALALVGAGVPFIAWPADRRRLAYEQLMLKGFGFEPGTIDGLWGQQTNDAWERWQNSLRTPGKAANPPPMTVDPLAKSTWPRQADVRKFYGEPGQNQAMLVSPYPLRLAWDKTQTVKRFSIHEKCHDSAERVMKRVLEHYGPVEIQRLGLDLFGGCLNVRKMKGGNALSMHSWGIAIDWDPERNQLRWPATRATMDDPPYVPFLNMWDEEGWVSLGRVRNYDWMHVQAARL